MSRLKNIVGWMVRGGDQTRAELAGQAAAIQQLQRTVADLQSNVDAQGADSERLRAEARGALDDLSARLGVMIERLDRLDGRVADHDTTIASLTRVVSPPVTD